MPEVRTIWTAVTLSGLGVTVVGAVLMGLSFSGVEFLARFDEQIFLPALVGLLVLVIGLVGWASQLGSRARARMAAIAFLPPLLVVLTAVFTKPNVHGIFALVLLASIPLFAVGIILGIMALASRRP